MHEDDSGPAILSSGGHSGGLGTQEWQWNSAETFFAKVLAAVPPELDSTQLERLSLRACSCTSRSSRPARPDAALLDAGRSSMFQGQEDYLY